MERIRDFIILHYWANRARGIVLAGLPQPAPA
jgi:hypothetical protein